MAIIFLDIRAKLHLGNIPICKITIYPVFKTLNRSLFLVMLNSDKSIATFYAYAVIHSKIPIPSVTYSAQ